MKQMSLVRKVQNIKKQSKRLTSDYTGCTNSGQTPDPAVSSGRWGKRMDLGCQPSAQESRSLVGLVRIGFWMNEKWDKKNNRRTLCIIPTK